MWLNSFKDSLVHIVDADQTIYQDPEIQNAVALHFERDQASEALWHFGAHACVTNGGMLSPGAQEV
jgi:hypothetical protein